MPLQHAILSLLDHGDSYGYRLRAEFERSAGPQGGRLNIGQLYQLLDRLRRDGLVEVVRTEPQPRRPDRHIYGITAAGREELRRWLETPSPPATGYRDELFLKLVSAAGRGADTLHDVIRRERGALLSELRALRALAGDQDVVAALLAEGAALFIEARLRLLDRAEHDHAALVQGAAPTAPAEGAWRDTSLDRSAGGSG